MAENGAKKVLVVRPTGVYYPRRVKSLVCLTAPFMVTRLRQSQGNLANGPMGDWRLRTGPDHKRIGVRHG
jgi:hypothetical protein